jgi:hypothetical protein
MSLSDAHYFEEMGVKKYEEIRHTFSKVYECVPDLLALSHPHTFSSSYFFMVTLDSKYTREVTFQNHVTGRCSTHATRRTSSKA